MSNLKPEAQSPKPKADLPPNAGSVKSDRPPHAECTAPATASTTLEIESDAVSMTIVALA